MERNIDKYHARLRHLAKSCEFHDADREIKSQIVQRCTLSKVRDKGLSDPDVSLNNLFKFVRTLEATEMHRRLTDWTSSCCRSRSDKDCFHHLILALHLSLCCESDVHESIFMSLIFRFLLMVSLNRRRGRPLFL